MSTFHFSAETTPPLAALRTFFQDCIDVIPSGVSVTVENSGVTIDETDGSLLGTWAGAAQTAVNGTSTTAQLLVAEGAMVKWKTQEVHGKRMLQGRTFFVPWSSGGLNPDGTLSNVKLATMRTAAATLIAGGRLLIWGRPRVGQGDLPDIPGQVASAVSAVVPTKAAVLRSRRD